MASVVQRASRRARAEARRVINKPFNFWERLGFHVTPVDYMSPIPDLRHLPREQFKARSELVGIDLREDDQLQLLASLAGEYKHEYERFPRTAPDEDWLFFVENESFVSTDAEVLYSLIRRLRPQRVVEIGSGYSSLLISRALTRNATDAEQTSTYTIIDPYPNPLVRDGLPGLASLRSVPVQEVPLNEFTSLERNDVLFIDSSHVSRVGSDVNYEFLEILPRLDPGVVVHVHDIFLPYEYPEQWVFDNRWFWTEQYLLQAFLTFNDAWDVMWAGSYMHDRRADELSAAFDSHGPTTSPGSFWMRRR